MDPVPKRCTRLDDLIILVLSSGSHSFFCTVARMSVTDSVEWSGYFLAIARAAWDSLASAAHRAPSVSRAPQFPNLCHRTPPPRTLDVLSAVSRPGSPRPDPAGRPPNSWSSWHPHRRSQPLPPTPSCLFTAGTPSAAYYLPDSSLSESG